MGQQLGIVAMVDIAAAIEANDLRGHLWLVDNGRWAGSTGEGTGNLASALDVTDSALAGAPILNWFQIGIGSIPITVPQTFFLHDEDRKALAQTALSAKHRSRFSARLRNILGEEINIRNSPRKMAASTEPTRALPHAGQGFLEPGRARFRNTRKSRVTRTDDQDLIHYPDPVIARIDGEAVEKKVIFPAQYGSPQLFSDGLYWSASVNPAMLGVYSYTLWITLYYARRDKDGEVTDHSVTLPHDAWISVSTGAIRSGFSNSTLDIIPA
ncbi:hypothetical protein [Rhodovulum sulfidophilum]|uniref:Uncharacterized protein n=2 Tax=Rhodovulum sulfidophilum TaxID=35806 RepID=A0A0D6B1Z1_RHOSU|nr:hypothetical protein [Rhodovulum sulfidophilum]MBL3552725.1 hypothetical protein [Rhodovulum sulfidophilum]MBL3609004.1 hypothetical protein [Rhodovulum sulfidophilum]MCE8456958.1 hypothetical protein [Rhodovulum sulfidophilum]BAQ69163.1 hypothetical protein NHU_02008 [Rhodovulum sulfidophilum]